MVLARVLIFAFLWIGTCNSMPHEFRRTLRQATHNERQGAQLPAVDKTSRMDLIKSIDDIIFSPYNGPHLENLDPLLLRNAIRRPERNSASFRRHPSESQSSFLSDENSDSDSFRQVTIGSSEFQRPFSGNSFRNPSSDGSRHETFVSSSNDSPSNERNRRQPAQDKKPSRGSFPSSFSFFEPQFDFDSPQSNRDFSFERAQDFENSRRRRPGESLEHRERRPSSSLHHRNRRPVESFRQEQRHPDGHSHSSGPLRAFSRDFNQRPSRQRRDTFLAERHPTKDDEGHEYDRQQSEGFIGGIPDDFPNFSSIGGFESLAEGAKEADHFERPQITSSDFNTNQVDGTEHSTLYKQDTKKQQNRTNETKSPSTNLLLTLSQDLVAEGSAHPPRYHRTVARKEANPESYIPHTRVPRQHSHHSLYDYAPDHRSESVSYYSREEDIYMPRNERDRIVPESQRFFPSFPQGRLYSHGSSSHPHHRGGRRGSSKENFSRRRPSFRNRGHHKAFASQSFNDYGPLDNSLLGSGNFEVIKGGTYYDNDDPHLNHNPYDPYLDNSYVVFPHGGNSHNHNHVDDFFSNFRDFSEFATRRSGTDHYDDGGYASEHIPLISSINDMMTSESKSNSTLDNAFHIIKTVKDKNTQKNLPVHKLISSGSNYNSIEKLKPKQIKKLIYTLNKNIKKTKQISKAPKNIQDVLQQVDPFPIIQNSKDKIQDLDPLIAIF